MSLLQILVVIFFVACYVFIAYEHVFKINKTAIALLMGSVLWAVLYVYSGVSAELLEPRLSHDSWDTFGLIVFILCSMTLVEILAHYSFFEYIKHRIICCKLSTYWTYWLISILTFFLSAFLADVIITLVMVTISTFFFKEKNLLLTTCMIILMANAWWLWSPIWDVTTIMMWLGDKFTEWQIIGWWFFPWLLAGLTWTFILWTSIVEDKSMSKLKCNYMKFSVWEKTIIWTTIMAFFFPLLASVIWAEPFLGSMFWLWLVWLVISLATNISSRESHMSAKMERFMQRVDINTIIFFIWLLLAVSALQEFWVLEYITELFYGTDPNQVMLIVGNMLIGAVSSIMDSIALTALVLHTIEMTPEYRVLLAISVALWGTFLIVWSISWVIAQWIVKELSFFRYIKLSFFAMLISFIVWCLTRYLEYSLIF